MKYGSAIFPAFSTNQLIWKKSPILIPKIFKVIIPLIPKKIPIYAHEIPIKISMKPGTMTITSTLPGCLGKVHWHISPFPETPLDPAKNADLTSKQWEI